MVVVFSVVIAVAMLGARACMRSHEADEQRADERGRAALSASAAAAANPGKGKYCKVTSEPSGATVYSLKGGERIALGVTPTEAEQGTYDIEYVFSGHSSVTAEVGVLDEPCSIHRALKRP